LLLSNWSIDPSTPVVPDELSKRSIGGVYQFPIVTLINALGVSASNMAFQEDVMRRFGAFLGAIVHGKDGIPAAELLANEDRLISAVKKMYRRKSWRAKYARPRAIKYS
jgi:hypothetical protein